MNATSPLVNTLPITYRITTIHDELRKSERKVADFVTKHAREVIHLRIIDLAQRAEVSEPTVVRFCRAIGYDGFQSFKLALAQELAASPARSSSNVNQWDNLEDTTRKVFDSTIDQLIQAREVLANSAEMPKAVQLLTKAKRVDFYGFGASSGVAADAQHKFFRLQIPTTFYSDPHLQFMAAMSLGPDDVVIAISHSGRTRELLRSIDKVIDSGGTVIALAPEKSPVAQKATVCLPVATQEDTRIFSPVTSRIAQMVMIDALVIAVAQQKGATIEEHLAKMHLGLEALRVD